MVLEKKSLNYNLYTYSKHLGVPVGGKYVDLNLEKIAVAIDRTSDIVKSLSFEFSSGQMDIYNTETYYFKEGKPSSYAYSGQGTRTGKNWPADKAPIPLKILDYFSTIKAFLPKNTNLRESLDLVSKAGPNYKTN